MISERNLLTVKEVAGLLRLSVSETYKLVQSEAITHFRVGPGRGAIRIEPAAVDAFLERRRVGKEVKEVVRRQAVVPLKHVKRK